MEDTPLRRLSLGPVDITLRPRAEGDLRRIGFVGSLGVHLLAMLLLVVLAPYWEAMRPKPTPEKLPEPTIPITFVSPEAPPPAPPTPRQPAPAPPKPAPSKELRMQAPPVETLAALKSDTMKPSERDAGRHDTRPAGGEAGGPLPRPTPGASDAKSDGAPSRDAVEGAPRADRPLDLNGRLQQFKDALDTPEPEGTKGPKGGGTGKGGITMPDVPESGMGIGNLEFEGRDYDWSSYARSIHGIIWRAWHNRLLATSGNFERWAAEHQRWVIDARSRIVFTINRTGRITGVAVETESGCYPFDDSAVDALREVILPPLPSDFPRDAEVVHATFIGTDVDIKSMHFVLSRLKEMGLF